MKKTCSTGASFSPKRKRICVAAIKCSVPSCYKNSRDNRHLAFHNFPNRQTCPSQFKEWVERLGIMHNVKANSKVCSSHFKKDDYIDFEKENEDDPNWYGVRQHVLKAGALPSANIPIQQVPISRMKSLLHQYQHITQRSSAKDIICQDNISITVCSNAATDQLAYKTPENVRECIMLDTPAPADPQFRKNVVFLKLGKLKIKELDSKCSNLCCRYPELESDGSYCKSDIESKKKIEFKDLVNSELTLYQLTGIGSFSLFNSIVEIYKEKRPLRTGTLNHEARVLLTFMKLRLNLSYTFLSILFSVSKPTSKSIFETTLIELDTMLEDALAWPTQEEVRGNIPLCFEKFKRVRVVLDCTEIKTTKARCLRCRCRTYSHYKGCHTCKFLLGVSPAGLFTFVSDAYGGRASDKHIFVDSKLIEKFDPYQDDVMVDKGFLIKEICLENNIGLIHPPFLTKKRPQFSKVEALRNVSVANARVHVERAIGKVKQYKILTDVLPWNTVYLAGTIMRVVCGMVNLSNPILAADKFPQYMHSSSDED